MRERHSIWVVLQNEFKWMKEELSEYDCKAKKVRRAIIASMTMKDASYII